MAPSFFFGMLFLLVTFLHASSFWAITDIHLADDYVPGTAPPPAFCTEGKGPAGPMGYYNCDSPRPLVFSALSFMQTLQSAPFVLFLGDSPTLYEEHPKHTMTKEMILGNMRDIALLLAHAFPEKGVFPTLGNHDCLPDSYISLPGSEHAEEWFGHLADFWSTLNLPQEALDTVRYAGYYTAPLVKGLRVVSLNTIYCSPLNPIAMLNQSDHGHQFQWLEKTLGKARANGEKVIIIGHIPPGSIDLAPIFLWTSFCWYRYLEILAQYSDIIVGQLFGHQHTDTFHLIQHPTEKNKTIGTAFSLPALTPRAAANVPLAPQTPGKEPVVRMYHYDDSSFELLDYDTYYANITEGNQRHPPGLIWQLEYSAKSHYGLASLQPQYLYDHIASRLETDDAIWNKFQAYFFSTRVFPCGEEFGCRKNVACAVQHADYVTFLNCAKTKDHRILASRGKDQYRYDILDDNRDEKEEFLNNRGLSRG